MTQLEGLRNFALNIKPTMLSIKNGEKVSQPELASLLQFYLEVLDYLSKAETI